MLKYDTTNVLPHKINTVLVEAWDAFKVSADNIIRDSFVKNIYPLSLLPTLPPTPMHVLSLSKYLLGSSMKTPMGQRTTPLHLLRYNKSVHTILWFYSKKRVLNIIIQEYCPPTSSILHCEETNRHPTSRNEEIIYVNTESKEGETGKNVRNTNTRKIHDSTPGIYPTYVKVTKFSMVAENIRKK